MTEQKNFLVVGAGISGCTLARSLAEKGNRVTVIDKRDEAGGNCADHIQHGIYVHKYGSHIFHTNNERVWKFLSRFTSWFPYQHKVLGLIDGQLVPIPFNLNSLYMLFPSRIAFSLEKILVEDYGLNRCVSISTLRESRNPEILKLADFIYENVFRFYSQKQWGIDPDTLDKSITGRVPVFTGRDDRYFRDIYQGIPRYGYTRMMEIMLNHKNIKTVFMTDLKGYDYSKMDHVFHSGAIDEFYDYQYGELPYRSLRFEFKEFTDRDTFQPCAVVNYPQNYDFTRISEFKWYTGIRNNATTVVSYEYPEAFDREKRNERFYPIISEENTALYQKYNTIKNEKITFFGRLGDYRYYNMDKAVERALELAEQY